MPLVRFEVKNEYKLGVPELYKNAAEREDSKGILDGVAAAGLVGVLRQLGDLTEFGGEVFHGLQEQVISTASRSHRLMIRLQHVEAALPTVEKASLSHTSDIHFAYTPGSEWHRRIRDDSNHFIYTDLPHCIMDSYEKCREPPRLQLLDRFDSGGPGSCLKKYSDPTFFWKDSGGIASKNAEKLRKDRRATRLERRRSCRHSGLFSHSSSIYNKSGRIQVSPLIDQGQASSAQTASSLSTSDLTFKSEIRYQTDSFESRDGTGCNECMFRPLTPMQADEAKPTKSSSRLDEQMTNTLRSDYHDEQTAVLGSGSPCRSGVGSIAPCSSYVSWDEKMKIVEPMVLNLGIDEAPDMCEPVGLTYLISATVEPPCELSGNSDLHVQLDSDDINTNEQLPIGFKGEYNLKPPIERNRLGEVDSETDYYVDALNIIESELETDCDYHCQNRRVEFYSCSEIQFVGNKEQPVGAIENSPSKPSDGNSSNNLNGSSISIDYIDRFQNPIHKADEPSGKLDSSLKLLQCDDVDISEADRGHNQNVCLVVGSSFQSLHSGLHSKLGESKNSLCKKADCLEGHVRNGDSQTHSETKLPVTAGEVNTTSSEFDNCNASKSTLVSGLSRSLLMVGFQKFHSSHDGKPESDSPVKICEYGNGQYDVSYHSFPGEDLSKQLNTPEMSLPSSPPLEHTNTSFQPLHSYQSSRLKLAYLDGAVYHNGALDVFPSFQLVPEPASLWHDIKSNSDDDAFCRSHPCLSDDCLKHLSNSSSELWESGDSLQAKDHALYDGLCEASSESFSSSPKYREAACLMSHIECKSDDRQTEIGIIKSHSGTALDPPVLGSINPFLYRETKTSANLELSESFKTLTPTPKPPPLPPLQWWLPKPQLNSVLDQQNSVPASLKQFTNSELLGSAISQPAKAVTEKLINATKLANSVAAGEQQLDKPMLNGNKDITKTGKGGKVDEKEDFLQQIREKSSNLRRTNTIRPACKTAPTASFIITAILEKANAIRKAVASDDGEDTDTWSDT